MKSILVIANDTQTIIWFRKDMIKGMIEKKCKVTIVAPDDNYRKEIEQLGVKLINLNYNRTGINPMNDIKLYFKYKNIIRKEKPDKIFAYNLKPVIYGILAAKSMKKIECYAMIPGAGYVFSNETIKAKIIKLIIKNLYKRALDNSEYVFFQNIDDKRQFVAEKIVKESKAIVVNGSGINLKQFEYSEIPNKPKFLFAARLLKTKGIIEFCEAAQNIKENFKEVQFDVIGGIDDNPTCIKEQQLQEYIDKNIINYYGKVNDVQNYLKNSSILVLPSYHREGVPHIVLEAMAVGRIIITTNEIGCKETVKEGINGFLIESKNTKMLTEKMKFIIENYSSCKKMGIESRKYAEEKFDVNSVNNIIFKNMKI